VRYHFPVGLTLDEARDAIAAANARIGMNGFVLADRGDHVIANYIVAMPGSFPEPNTGDPAVDREHAVLRELRGITFDKASGRVVARKFHKFFNAGEKPETQHGVIDWSRPHDVLEKLDGSMLTPYRGANGMEWHTKMGFTDVAKPVLRFVEESPLPYVEFADACRREGITPIMEWCSRQQRIVVDYPVEALVVTALRENESGRYLGYETMRRFAGGWDMPVVVSRGSLPSLTDFMREIEAMEGAEGCVIRFADGHAVKVKGRWYLDIHRTKDMLKFEKDVWGLVLADRVDDLLPFLTPPDRAALEGFAAELAVGIARTAARLQTRVEVAREAIGQDRRRFAEEWVQRPEIPSLERGLLFGIWSGLDPVASVRKVLASNCSTSTKVEEVRNLAGGVRWDRFSAGIPEE
jgi:RNA ligase